MHGLVFALVGLLTGVAICSRHRPWFLIGAALIAFGIFVSDGSGIIIVAPIVMLIGIVVGWRLRRPVRQHFSRSANADSFGPSSWSDFSTTASSFDGFGGGDGGSSD
jgi:hypothetical protein